MVPDSGTVRPDCRRSRDARDAAPRAAQTASSCAAAGKRMTSRIGGRAGEEHDQAVDAHAHAAGRRHAVLHRLEEVLVELVRLSSPAARSAICCRKRSRWSSGSLSSREGVAHLHAGDEALEALDEARVVRRLLGERAELERVLGDEHRLDELGLDHLAEELVDLRSPGRRQRHALVEAARLRWPPAGRPRRARSAPMSMPLACRGSPARMVRRGHGGVRSISWPRNCDREVADARQPPRRPSPRPCPSRGCSRRRPRRSRAS